MLKWKINGVELPVSPATFKVAVLDLDDADGSGRTADGTHFRDRVATKRKFEVTWKAMRGSDLAIVLQAMQDEYSDWTYPDPMTNSYITKRFYVGDRNVGLSFERNGELWWSGLSVPVTEQ